MFSFHSGEGRAIEEWRELREPRPTTTTTSHRRIGETGERGTEEDGATTTA